MIFGGPEVLYFGSIRERSKGKMNLHYMSATREPMGAIGTWIVDRSLLQAVCRPMDCR